MWDGKQGEEQRHVPTHPSAGSFFYWLFAWPASSLGASSNVTSTGKLFLTLCLSRFPSLVIFHLPSQGSEGQLRPFCEQILKNLKSVMLVEDGAIVLVNDVKCEVNKMVESN